MAFVFLHQWTECFMRVEKYVKCKFSYLLLWLHWSPATLDLCISALLCAVAVCWIADEQQTAHKLKLYLDLCSNCSPATDQIQLLDRQEMSILKELVWPRSWFIQTKASSRMKDANVCLKASSTMHKTQRITKCSPEVLSSGLLSQYQKVWYSGVGVGISTLTQLWTLGAAIMTAVARDAYRCDTGASITQLIGRFLIAFKAGFTEENAHWVL